MEWYCSSLTKYERLKTREVRVGELYLGYPHPIRVQTMTTTDTMDTPATVAQVIRCIEAGAELVRITAPSKNDAENLLSIHESLRKQGYSTPLVADIHFTPNAAEIAARIVEKVRVNPGNYVDKKKFEQRQYTDATYQDEMDRVRDRFRPLLKICKEYGTAMRIGTNHGSLSDRIMSRYGDTPMGMVESAMEFLRFAREESFHNIVLSMKSSNPLVMVQAYRLLIHQMQEEFRELYPLHLGVTEAGDGEDGRIKSAIGIGSLLEDGIGDTIRVSLTEDPEFEIPVCRDMVKRYQSLDSSASVRISSHLIPSVHTDLSGTDTLLHYSPFEYRRRESFSVKNIGAGQVPVVISDLHHLKEITPKDLSSIGYHYEPALDKWNLDETAADYVYTGASAISFDLPGTLRSIVDFTTWESLAGKDAFLPLLELTQYQKEKFPEADQLFIRLDCFSGGLLPELAKIRSAASDPRVIFCIYSTNLETMPSLRRMMIEWQRMDIRNPVILMSFSPGQSPDEHLVHFATETGALLLDGFGDGLFLSYDPAAKLTSTRVGGRTYLPVRDIFQFTNNTAFSILQATRTRISKTEYISCPSCGRTLFDLQETTAKIRSVSSHLKGLKIAIMGCIVNGPGEMADADFGYVGSGPGKITLYKGKEIVKRNVDSRVAVDELIGVLKENGAWTDPEEPVVRKELLGENTGS